MKLYAIRDRLIDYYLTPFAAHTDNEVMASLASAINNPESLDAIAQTPHHFEIWAIGEIDQEGHLTAAKQLLADCSTLVRPKTNDGAGSPRDQNGLYGGRRSPTGGKATEGGRGTPTGFTSPQRAPERAIEDPASSETVPRASASQTVPGIPEGA